MRFKEIALAFLLPIALVACDPREKDPEVLPPVITAENVELTPAAQQASIEYSIENPVGGTQIVAETSEDWISDFDYSTDGLLKFYVELNDGDQREAQIKLSYETAEDITIDVTQQPAGNSLDILPNNLSFVQAGGDMVVKITSDRPWTMTGSSSWLVPSIKEGPSGESEIVFTAKANDSDDSNEATFQIESGTVKQDIVATQGFTGRITIGQTLYEVGAEQNDVSVTLQTSKPVSVKFADTYGWISETTTRAMESKTFIFNVSENTSFIERAAVVIFENEDVSEQVEIRQEKGLPSNYFDAIPDNNFRTALTGAGIDSDSNGELSLEEVLAVKSLKFEWGNGIKDFSGLEYFANLEAINLKYSEATELTLSNSKIVDLDVSYNSKLAALDITALTEVTKMQLAGNKLQTIDLSSQTKAKELYMNANPIKSVDLSSLKLLENYSLALSEEAELSEIDFSANTNLKTLNLTAGNLTSIDLSKNVNLETLTLGSCIKIKSLDITNNVNLVSFSMQYATFGTFDFSNQPKLRAIDLKFNDYMMSIDVSANLILTTLDLYLNRGLKEVWMSEGQYIPNITTSVDDDGLFKYKSFAYPADCTEGIEDENLRKYLKDTFDTDSNGAISETEAKAVTSIDCRDKGIVNFSGMTYFPNVTSLDCSNNPMTNLEVDFFTKLQVIRANDTKLTKVYLDRIETLTEISMANSELSSVEGITRNKDLEKLVLANNKFNTNLRVYYLGKMKYIDVSNNELPSIDIHYNEALEYIDISNNNITYTAHWTLIKVKELYIQNNPFTELDYSHYFVDLEKFNASGTKLKELDFSKSPRLTEAIAKDCENLKKIYIGDLDASVFQVDPEVELLKGEVPL